MTTPVQMRLDRAFVLAAEPNAVLSRGLYNAEDEYTSYNDQGDPDQHWHIYLIEGDHFTAANWVSIGNGSTPEAAWRMAAGVVHSTRG